MTKPKLTIDNFSGMSDNGAYYLENFSPIKINGKSVLRQWWNMSKWTDDTEFPDLNDNPKAYIEIVESGATYVYTIGSKNIGRFWATDPNGAGAGSSVIHTIDDGTALDSCAYPDIHLTEKGNILYTSGRYLNRGVYGYQNSSDDNSSDKVIDDEGRNFSDLGVSVGDVVHKLNGYEYATITSISTTYETNDTLNFTAFSNSGAIDGDEPFVVFVDAWEDFGYAEFSSPHWKTQDAPYSWSRQIVNFGGDYYIGNGNYIAKLANDEDTFTSEFSQLPAFCQFRSMAVNGQFVLIGGNVSDRGKLILWDGINAGSYANIVDIPAKLNSVIAYGTGWIVQAGASIYYTNGYSVKELTRFPDTDYNDNAFVTPQGMDIVSDKLIVGKGDGVVSQGKPGVYVYDILKNDFNFVPILNIDGNKEFHSIDIGSVKYLTDAGYIFVGCSDNSSNVVISRLSESETETSLAIFRFTAPSTDIINRIELIIGKNLEETFAEATTAKITVGVANTNDILWGYSQAYTTSSNKDEIQVNGSTYTMAEVGYLVRVLTKTNSSEIAFISSIDDKGLSSEKWTLDRELSGNTQNQTMLQVMPFKKIGEYDISTKKLINPYPFDLGQEIYGDFFLMVHIESDTGLDIRKIDIL